MQEKINGVDLDEYKNIQIKDSVPESEAQPKLEYSKLGATGQTNIPQKEETPKALDLETVDNELEVVQVQKDRNLFKQCVIYCKTEVVPQAFRNKPELTYSALKMLQGLGANGIQFLQKVAPINGNLSIWGEFPLTLVRNSGLLENFDEYLIDKDYKKISLENKNLDAEVFAAVCVTQRKGEQQQTFTYLTEDAKKIPNFTRMSAVWKPYFKIMMMYKARALALKSIYPDVLMGIRIAEYDDHQTPQRIIKIEKEKPKEIEFTQE